MLAIGAVRSSATLKQLISPTCDQIIDLLHAIEERIIYKKLTDFGCMAKLHRDLVFHCGFLLANRFFNSTFTSADLLGLRRFGFCCFEADAESAALTEDHNFIFA